MRWIFFLIIFLSLSVYAQDPWKNIYTKNAWEERDKWQRASDLLKQMSLQKGDKVADIGCHEGYMTMKLSKAVGNTGEVFAVDVDQRRLDKLKGYLDEGKIFNVTVVKGDYDNPNLAFNSLDAVIIMDTYHEMDDHDEILKHVKASLKSDGRLLLCEPIAEERRKLSRADQEAKHELGMEHALADLEKAGFKILFKQDPFIDRLKVKGDEMWIIIATKN